jgi:hypothetical protein
LLARLPTNALSTRSACPPSRGAGAGTERPRTGIGLPARSGEVGATRFRGRTAGRLPERDGDVRVGSGLCSRIQPLTQSREAIGSCAGGAAARYRNPGTATPASIRIAYRDDKGEWASLQPDFIIVSRRSDGTLAASIVDPHGDYLADARAKLQALAAFAEQFADRFVRVESVAKVEDGGLRVLDLADPAVRAGVLAFQGGKVTGLYQSEHSRPYR